MKRIFSWTINVFTSSKVPWFLSLHNTYRRCKGTRFQTKQLFLFSNNSFQLDRRSTTPWWNPLNPKNGKETWVHIAYATSHCNRIWSTLLPLHLHMQYESTKMILLLMRVSCQNFPNLPSISAALTPTQHRTSHNMTRNSWRTRTRLSSDMAIN